VLPRPARLRLRRDFTLVIRHGRRAGSSTLVVHVLSVATDQPRVGFVVSRAVGGAVIRNRVTRRLRHACRARLDQLAPAHVVVRALPAAAVADNGHLLSDLDSCLRRAGATR